MPTRPAGSLALSAASRTRSTKAKELAKTREIALESKKETEIKPIVQESEIRTTETIAPEHQTTTVKRIREVALTIKTPAQVEAERAASKSTITTTSTTTHTTSKPVTTTAHSGSWIIQVGCSRMLKMLKH